MGHTGAIKDDMKSISVLGVQLNDLSVREAMKLSNLYLNSESLSTICFVNAGLMLEARDSEEVKACIEGMDLVVPTSADVVSAFGYREREISNNLFLKELLKKLSKEKKRIFVVAKSEDDQVAVREALLGINDRLVFFGCFSLGENVGTEDSLVNEINSVLPDVVVSLLDSPEQEALVMRVKPKVNSRMWLMLKEENLRQATGGNGKLRGIKDFLDRVLFKRIITKYDSTQKEGN